VTSSSQDLAEQDLARSGITLAQAEAAGMFAADTAQEEPYDTDFHNLPALVIPYADPLTGEQMTFERSGAELPFLRVRYLKTPPQKRGLIKKKPQRYGQPKNSGVRAYFPRTDNVDWREAHENREVPILITEGEKKSLAACLAGVPTIGLGGVYNFLVDGRLLPELDRLGFDGRTVYICFDSDAASNPDVQAAEGRLATELSLKRGADVFLARLPNLPKHDKTGLDDFLAAKGVDALFEVFKNAPQMRKIDAAVLGLNRSVAWIERDGMVLDTEAQEWIKKHDFCSGSKYSALSVVVPTLKGDSLKHLSVAQEFLTHPLARRYNDVVFKPDADAETLVTPSGVSLNLWRGWEPESGDVQPFLDLSEFLFSDIPPEQQDIPLKLIAYKAQNPGVKVPLALVLLGTQGCGKSFWAQIVREAFAPYGAAVTPRALVSDFNGWVERSLVVVLDEARGVDISKGSETLKSLITETRTFLNEKYRAARQVDSYAMYILTSNDRRVGAYSQDDRRMFVISCPPKREKAFYDALRAWRDAGGPKRLLGWLLDYDLKGWVPPQAAPMTAEKYMAYMESLTPVQRLAEEMATADENVVKAWIDGSMAWANAALLDERQAARAKEIRDALMHYQIRPFYTPEEIATLFPAITAALHGAKDRGTPAGEISRQLRECGVTYLRCKDDPRGFRWRGLVRQYLVIADQQEWAGAALTQAQFETAMQNFPKYGAALARKKAGKGD
jgi:hypothetical protein